MGHLEAWLVVDADFRIINLQVTSPLEARSSGFRIINLQATLHPDPKPYGVSGQPYGGPSPEPPNP